MINLIQMAETMEEMAQDLRAAKLAQDGWIEWRGGACPVVPNALVDVLYRGGYGNSRTAMFCEWGHDGRRCDIIAYRVVQDDSDAKKIEALQSQVANLNSLCISRGRENEKLRAELAGLRNEMEKANNQISEWWQSSHDSKLKLGRVTEELEECRRELLGADKRADYWHNEYKRLARWDSQHQCDAAAAKLKGIGIGAV